MVAIPVFLLNDWPFSYFDSAWGLWSDCFSFDLRGDCRFIGVRPYLFGSEPGRFEGRET
jgi:hypothetical protein